MSHTLNLIRTLLAVATIVAISTAIAIAAGDLYLVLVPRPEISLWPLINYETRYEQIVYCVFLVTIVVGFSGYWAYLKSRHD